MSKPLFALADEFLELARVLSDEQEMPNDIIDEILEAYSGELETKCWNVAAMIQRFEVAEMFAPWRNASLADEKTWKVVLTGYVTTCW
ncbi:MAG: hypothetical protein IPQ01_03955 [Zoogloea sp.]|nr:hypothetical protein [Zoogloea sp.]